MSGESISSEATWSSWDSWVENIEIPRAFNTPWNPLCVAPRDTHTHTHTHTRTHARTAHTHTHTCTAVGGCWSVLSAPTRASHTLLLQSRAILPCPLTNTERSVMNLLIYKTSCLCSNLILLDIFENVKLISYCKSTILQFFWKRKYEHLPQLKRKKMRVIRKAERDRNSLGTQSMPGPCRLYLHQPWILSSLCCCFSALSMLSLQPGGAFLFHSTYKGFVDQRIREPLIRLPREKVIAPFSPINTYSSYNALHDGYLKISFMSIFFFFDHVAWVHRYLYFGWIEFASDTYFLQRCCVGFGKTIEGLPWWSRG